MTECLRKHGRSLLAHVLYYSGILWLIAAIRFRRSAFVLTYHRVLPGSADTYSADGIVVRPETFAMHMSFLRRHFRVLSIEDLAACFTTGRPLPSGGCLVTFDDGWLDNFEHALPILRRQDIPAVVFVATGFVGTSHCFWQERLARRLHTALRHGGAPGHFAQRLLGRDVSSLDAQEQKRVVREMVDRWKNRTAAEIQALEAELQAVLSAAGLECRANGDDRFMAWSQVRALTEGSGICIGAHGCSHLPLTAMTRQQAGDELLSAREQIGAAVGQPVVSVAYPNGDFDPAVLALARDSGYQLGFTTEKGSVAASDDPLRLRRINVHESATRSAAEFLCAILLVFQRLRRPQRP